MSLSNAVPKHPVPSCSSNSVASGSRSRSSSDGVSRHHQARGAKRPGESALAHVPVHGTPHVALHSVVPSRRFPTPISHKEPFVPCKLVHPAGVADQPLLGPRLHIHLVCFAALGRVKPEVCIKQWGVQYLVASLLQSRCIDADLDAQSTRSSGFRDSKKSVNAPMETALPLYPLIVFGKLALSGPLNALMVCTTRG